MSEQGGGPVVGKPRTKAQQEKMALIPMFPEGMSKTKERKREDHHNSESLSELGV